MCTPGCHYLQSAMILASFISGTYYYVSGVFERYTIILIMNESGYKHQSLQTEKDVFDVIFVKLAAV